MCSKQLNGGSTHKSFPAPYLIKQIKMEAAAPTRPSANDFPGHVDDYRGANIMNDKFWNFMT